MSEQDNYLFKVVGSIVMGYGMEKPNEETLAIANKIIDLVAQATEQRIIKLLEERLTGCSGYECETCDEVSGIIRAIALIKGEN